MGDFLKRVGEFVGNICNKVKKSLVLAYGSIIIFIKEHKTTSILSALGVAILVFAFLSIGRIGDFYFQGNEKNPSDNSIESKDKDKGDISMGLDHYMKQPASDIKLFKKDVKVKGIYISGWVAGVENRFDRIIKMVNETELNSIVLDVKEDKGKVTYKSEVPWVNEVNASVNMVGDMNKILKKLSDNDIYPIARIVCFKDPILGEKRPELALKSKGGGLWRDNKGVTWLNPYNKESWKYLVELSKEAARLGFQDIQYDYVRFPTDGKVGMIDYGEAALSKTKAEAISEFLAYAKKELEPFGVDISADIFGIVSIVEGDYEQIGQHLEMVAKDIDYICPMVYPSHYANVAQNGVGQRINGILFRYPDLEPYQVVYNTMLLTKERLEKANSKAKGRPYLQDFTAPYLGRGNYQVYGAEQVRAQIKATYDAGFEEWILWDANNKYTEAALLRKSTD